MVVLAFVGLVVLAAVLVLPQTATAAKVVDVVVVMCAAPVWLVVTHDTTTGREKHARSCPS